MLHNIIYSKLAVIVSRVFPGIAPDKTTLPYIVFFPVSNQPSPDGSGQSLLDHIRLQISCFGRSFLEVETMSAKVRRVLDELIEDSYGIKIQRVTFTNDIYIPEGNGVHHRALDYMVYVVPKPAYLSKVKYGRLYNYPAVVDSRGIAPAGYHVPTIAEWETLIDHLGGASLAGAKLMSARTEPLASPRWNAPHKGTGESGFEAYGSGERRISPVEFRLLDAYAYIWTSSSVNENYANRVMLYRDTLNAQAAAHSHKNQAHALRLIRDNLTGYSPWDTVTDRDGNVYDTIRIGEQIWMMQNFACTQYSNGVAIPNVTDAEDWGDLTTGAYCNYDNNTAHPLFTDDEISLI